MRVLKMSQSLADRASSPSTSATAPTQTMPLPGTLCMFGIQSCTIKALRYMYRLHGIQEIKHVGRQSMELRNTE